MYIIFTFVTFPHSSPSSKPNLHPSIHNKPLRMRPDIIEDRAGMISIGDGFEFALTGIGKILKIDID